MASLAVGGAGVDARRRRVELLVAGLALEAATVETHAICGKGKYGNSDPKHCTIKLKTCSLCYINCSAPAANFITFIRLKVSQVMTKALLPRTLNLNQIRKSPLVPGIFTQSTFQGDCADK